jgi:hypothetical protein
MMVPSKQQQAQVLLEAVANHAPDVVIIDEIGTREVGARYLLPRYLPNQDAVVRLAVYDTAWTWHL